MSKIAFDDAAINHVLLNTIWYDDNYKLTLTIFYAHLSPLPLI